MEDIAGLTEIFDEIKKAIWSKDIIQIVRAPDVESGVEIQIGNRGNKKVQSRVLFTKEVIQQISERVLISEEAKKIIKGELNHERNNSNNK